MSHLKHFGVGNFKAFKELTQFELFPITILTGKNNSGKSSLMKSLLLIRKSPVERKNIFSGYNFDKWEIDDPMLKLGSPDEFLNHEGKSKTIKLEYSLNSLMLPNGIISLEYALDNTDETFNLVTFRISRNNESIIEIDRNVYLDDPFDFESNQCIIKIDFQYFINRFKELVPDKSKVNHFELGKKIGLYNQSDSSKSNKIVMGMMDLLENDLVILGFKTPFYMKEMEKNVPIDICLQPNYKEIDISKEDLTKIQNRLFTTYKNGFLFPNIIFSDSSISEFVHYDMILDDKTLEAFNHDELLVKKTEQQCSWWRLDDNNEKTLSLKPNLHPFFEYLKTFFHNLLDNFQNEFTNITYLPSIRARNERLYQVSREGYSIQEIDQKAFEKIDFKNEVIHQFYSDALKNFEIGEKIEIETFERTATKITIIRNGKKMLLSDLGFGYAQLIPIILNILISAGKWRYWRYKEVGRQYRGDISSIRCPKILIEEPESNLHPDFQSKLADLFVKASNLFGIQFIIETHSEYLIRRMQYLTAKKDINPKDISIYYFNNPEKIPQGEKQITKIDISSYGNLSQEFGTSFLDEADNLAIKLLVLSKHQKN